MCSIAMPAELILGHSPPVYSSLLYSPLVVTAPTITSRSMPPRIRPCLSTASLALNTLRNNDGSGKQKKRVVFADDRGRPLTQVLSQTRNFNRRRFTPSNGDRDAVSLRKRINIMKYIVYIIAFTALL